MDECGHIQMTPCDGSRTSKRWCCGHSNACCHPDYNPDAVILAQILGEALPRSSDLSTTDATGSSTTVSSSSPIIAGTSGASHSSLVEGSIHTGRSGGGELSTGSKAGIAVATAVGILILTGLGFFLAKALQWTKKANALQETRMDSVSTYQRLPYIPTTTDICR